MGIYSVGADGKARKGLKRGDMVVTAAGTYTITGVNGDGSYVTGSPDKGITSSNFGGVYSDECAPRGSGSQDCYKKLLNDTVKANNEAAGSSLLSLDKQKKEQEAAYKLSARNAYVNYMNARKSTSEGLGKNGLSNSGSGERLMKRNDADYSGDLSEAASEKIAADAQVQKNEAEVLDKLAQQNNKATQEYYDGIRSRSLENAELAVRQKNTVKKNAFTLLNKGVYSERIAADAGISYSEAEQYAKNAAGVQNKQFDRLVNLILSDPSYMPTAYEKNLAGMTDAMIESLRREGRRRNGY